MLSIANNSEYTSKNRANFCPTLCSTSENSGRYQCLFLFWPVNAFILRDCPGYKKKLFLEFLQGRNFGRHLPEIV